MGNNAHLKNQSKLINTFEQSYGYIIKLNRRGKPSVLRIKWSFFVKPWGSFTQGRFVPNLVEIGPVVLGRKIFKLGKYIFAICHISPWKRGMTLHVNKFQSQISDNMSPLHPRMICAKFGWIWPSGSGEEDF